MKNSIRTLLRAAASTVRLTDDDRDFLLIAVLAAVQLAATIAVVIFTVLTF